MCECGVSSNNEVYYAATHSARQPEIALNSLVGVGAMTKTKKSIERVVVLRPALYEPLCIDLFEVGQAQQAHDYDDGNLA